METSREYYDRVMSDYKTSRGRRSLRKYCQDEGIDYQWLMKSRKEFSGAVQSENSSEVAVTAEHFIPLEITDTTPQVESRPDEWGIPQLILSSPTGDITIKADSLSSVVNLLQRLM